MSKMTVNISPGSFLSTVKRNFASLNIQLSLIGSDWPDFGPVLSWSVGTAIAKYHRLSDL